MRRSLSVSSFLVLLVLAQGCIDRRVLDKTNYNHGWNDGFRAGLGLDSPERVVDRYTRLFHDRQQTTWASNSWLGIPAHQNPNDAWITQEIIVEQKPDVMVETGTFRGGSAILWAMVLREVNPKGRVLTIDIEDMLGATRENPVFTKHVDFLVGSSIDPEIVREVHRRAAGKNVLVLLDSNHAAAHVLGEMRAYAPLVPVGGYLIVQDSMVSGHPVQCCGPGPWEAIDQFLAQNHDFEPDRSRERLLHTQAPRGYLRRIK